MLPWLTEDNSTQHTLWRSERTRSVSVTSAISSFARCRTLRPQSLPLASLCWKFVSFSMTPTFDTISSTTCSAMPSLYNFLKGLSYSAGHRAYNSLWPEQDKHQDPVNH